ncbi:MAG: hypothetical protein KIS78_01985 [Labilithrix sp.]|nr:hypothetical protein [Labilithrix sp.]
MTVTSKEQLQDLDPDVRDLLSEEQCSAEVMPSAQKARILRKLERTLELPPEGGPGGGAAGGGGASPTEGKLVTKGVLPLAALAVAAATLLIHRASMRPGVDLRPEGMVAVAPASAMAASVDDSPEAVTPTLEVSALPDARPSVASSPKTVAAAAPGRSSAPARDGLAEERELIASLRTALLARHFDEATRLLSKHEATFPHGQLVTEREALRVWLLEDTGQKAAASAHAKQFHETYPNSVLRSAVERRSKE